MVTCWYRTDDLCKPWSFNHLADGYDPELLVPEPSTDYQRSAWGGTFWKSKPATLVNGVVTEDPFTGVK